MVFFLSKALVFAIAVLVGALLGIKTFQQKLVEAKVRHDRCFGRDLATRTSSSIHFQIRQRDMTTLR
jgi:hypothetical protein